MPSEYTQLSDEQSLVDYPFSPQLDSPMHSLMFAPALPLRPLQLSLPDISPLGISEKTVGATKTMESPTDHFSDCDYTPMPLEGSEPGSLSTPRPTERPTMAHPYARLYAKKDTKKRPRKIWNHKLEKRVFTEHELITMGAPHRRTIYTASLEAHIDRLHAQLLSIGLYPIPMADLEPYRGLNVKTAKVSIESVGILSDSFINRAWWLACKMTRRILN